MRIISGTAKGRRLHVPSTNDVRPTTDRVREALFSHLGQRVPGSVVLDLFGGSGALGLESLSRGAQSAVFVEQSRNIFVCLKKNVAELGFDSLCECIQSNAIKWLKTLSTNPQTRFDLIFLDPPYDSDALTQSLEIIAQNQIMADAGIIVAEHRTNFRIKEAVPLESFEILRTKQYGKTAITTMEWATRQHDS